MIMKEKVYKVVFDKNSYELNIDYDKFTESEKEIISNILPNNYFEWNSKEDNYTIIMILNDHNITKYISILKRNNIKFKLINLSNDILENGIDLSKELVPHINIINSTKWSKFKSKIIQWNLEHLDIDIILDRINKVGSIDKLTQIEKQFLDNYKV
jgi:hypothetical protein